MTGYFEVYTMYESMNVAALLYCLCVNSILNCYRMLNLKRFNTMNRIMCSGRIVLYNNDSSLILVTMYVFYFKLNNHSCLSKDNRNALVYLTDV